jgi:hypothetical protein
VVVSVKAKAHAEVGSGTIVVSVESTVEAEVGSVVSFEDAVNSEVGGSSGEGVEEISESQNINGDLSGTRSSPIAAGRVISLEDGIFRRLSDGRRRGAALDTFVSVTVGVYHLIPSSSWRRKDPEGPVLLEDL